MSPSFSKVRSWIFVLAIALMAVSLAVVPAPPAAAAEPLKFVHEEVVEAGPYELTVRFSKWPLAEGVSSDIVFDPAGGIKGKSGTLTIRTPTGEVVDGGYWQDLPLARHPRQRESWGLDVVSFTDAGTGGRFTFEFTLDGPQGPGAARVVLPFEELPGPPQELSWLLATIPTLLISAVILIGLIRVRPSRRPGSWALQGDPA